MKPARGPAIGCHGARKPLGKEALFRVKSTHQLGRRMVVRLNV